MALPTILHAKEGVVVLTMGAIIPLLPILLIMIPMSIIYNQVVRVPMLLYRADKEEQAVKK